MKDLKGKKLLILGDTYSTIGVIQLAKRLGVYTVVTGIHPNGDARKYADESIMIPSDDHESLTRYINDAKIDGVMTGASEFQIQNMILLCAKAKLPVYATKEQWDICQDKSSFKQLCRNYDVPVVPEYEVGATLRDEEFPVIVKPSDGCSARGLIVCYNNEELRVAEALARQQSPTGRILIEHYIQNGGRTMSAKYIVSNGEYYLEIISDRYVMDNGKVTAFVEYPSSFYDLHLKKVNPNIKEMFRSIGIENGVFSLQEIPENDNVFLHEMCLRVTGGMVYKITDAVGNGNALEMLIHFALTGEMCEEKDVRLIDARIKGKSAASLSIPLNEGKISAIDNYHSIASMKNVVDVTTYYHLGDVITKEKIGSLDQLFARIIVVAESREEMFETYHAIRNSLSIKDTNGEDMIVWDTFDKLYDEFVSHK